MTQQRIYDARPDSMDFRDEMFIPTLVNVPATKSSDPFRKLKLPVLDQGSEGACTGFALATVCHYLLKTVPGSAWGGSPVSARMLYIMARRYDEWPGTDYEGSSARGAIKGWHKHGVCSSRLWPNLPAETSSADRLTTKRAENAARTPLGAYFRVNHRDLVAMHAAINEVDVLFATSLVHEGWDKVGEDGVIEQQEKMLGGHAFVLVGYDENGFWLQNSWGTNWGKRGLAHVSYSDWLSNGMDVWAARLGVPVKINQGNVSTAQRRGVETSRYSQNELRNHIVSVGNDGALRQSGLFASVEEDIEEIFAERLPQKIRQWRKPRILVYAHGGLVSEKSAIEGIESNLPRLLENEIYP
ncbi:MAG: C1 family peptidase, partial [Gammaproteobacteria bacterium]|nr:C1 family peptidase [Gammaproteobacteria bacterium]